MQYAAIVIPRTGASAFSWVKISIALQHHPAAAPM
jgi:hypothetical protein